MILLGYFRENTAFAMHIHYQFFKQSFYAVSEFRSTEYIKENENNWCNEKSCALNLDFGFLLAYNKFSPLSQCHVWTCLYSHQDASPRLSN